MALPTTFTGLVSTIQEAAEDNSLEFIEYIPTAILLAEERVVKALDMKRLSTKVLTSAISTAGVSVSTGINDQDFLYFNHVFLNNTKLDSVDYSYVREINRYETSAGTSARYYAFLDDPNTIILAPPVSSGKVEVVYTERPQRLGTTNETNELINNAPDVLFYATMVEMSLFMKNWETVNNWETYYTEAIRSHLNTTRRERRDVGQGHFAVGVDTQSTQGDN